LIKLKMHRKIFVNISIQCPN